MRAVPYVLAAAVTLVTPIGLAGTIGAAPAVILAVALGLLTYGAAERLTRR